MPLPASAGSDERLCDDLRHATTGHNGSWRDKSKCKSINTRIISKHGATDVVVLDAAKSFKRRLRIWKHRERRSGFVIEFVFLRIVDWFESDEDLEEGKRMENADRKNYRMNKRRVILLTNRWLKNCKFWVISSSCDASNEWIEETEIACTSVRLIEIQRLPLVVNIIVTVVAEDKECIILHDYLF